MASIEDMMAMDFLGIQLFCGITSPSSYTSHFLSDPSSEAWMVTCSSISQERESQLESVMRAGLLLRSKKLLKTRLMTEVGKRHCK